MPIIRTPDDRFTNLSDFPYPPNYIEIGGMRVHYVDEGAGQIVLCLHGEPTWSYLYRKMIPILSKEHIAIAPDFVGFGRSDKYTELHEYTYKMHRDTLIGFVERLDLKQITLVVQDWGGLVGLRVVSLIPERFSRLVIMNTALPSGSGKLPRAFLHWRDYVVANPDLPIGDIMQGRFLELDANHPIGIGDDMPAPVVAGYEAPFPGLEYKAGARAWPLLVPEHTEDEAASELKAAEQFLGTWKRPALVMFSDSDPITRYGELYFQYILPKAEHHLQITIKNASHFLQEDRGEELAGHILDFMASTPI